MTFNEYSQVVSNNYTFHEVVDSACEKLMEYQIKITIQRINKMEKILSEIEHDLNEFMDSNIGSKIENKIRFSKRTRN